MCCYSYSWCTCLPVLVFDLCLCVFVVARIADWLLFVVCMLFFVLLLGVCLGLCLLCDGLV